MIAAAAALYIHPGNIVADVTYGLGAFWRKTDASKFKLLASDLIPRVDGVQQLDFRKLPYGANSIDVVVLDPAYIHNTGTHLMDDLYQNGATTPNATHADIIKLYRKGMIEAFRVLKAGGQMWIKIKDEIESGKQCFSHLEICDIAKIIGMSRKDMFVLVTSPPANRWGAQIHARKNHSFLLIFEKTSRILK
jgi:hypothetical protein